MTYDPSGPPPRSVEIQRRIEDLGRRIDDALTPARLVFLAVIGFLADIFIRGDSAGPGGADLSPILSILPSTPTEWALSILGFLGLGVALWCVVVFHETCHWIALRWLGVESFVEVPSPQIAGYTMPIYPRGGATIPRWSLADQHLSWTEDAIVSFAPVVLSVIVSIPVVLYHGLVSPLPDIHRVLGFILLVTGPSISDYLRLLRSPRSRWEWLIEFDDGLESHRIVELGTSAGE